MPICLTLYHLRTPYIASLAQFLPKETLHKSLVVVVPSWSMNLLSSLTVLASPLNLLNAPPQPFDLPLIYSPCTTSTVLLTRLLTPRNRLSSSTNLAHYSSLLLLVPMNSCSLVTSISMLTLPLTLSRLTSLTFYRRSTLFNMSTSQLTSKTTPLTCASHLPHRSYLQRYHALPSTSLITTLSLLTSKSNPLSDPPLPPIPSVSLAPSIGRPSPKIFSSPNSFSTLHLFLRIYCLATTQHFLRFSTPMPHSSPNAVHIQPTPGSPHTSKLLKLSAGVLSTSTNAPRTLLLEQKPWSLVNLKSATHRYHTLITAAKKKYYSSLIHCSSTNPRHLWRAVNSLLHRKSSYPLPSSIPSPSIADTFCSFFSDKISSLPFTLRSLLDLHAASTDPPPSPGLTPPISHSSLLISHSPTTSPISPAPASCTYAISAASDPCLTLKLHPPLPPPSSTQN